ncbi:hypothetical protein J2X35_001270 [Mesorhizobium sp. BE184]|nr:hypothetical protein [Mesorhizobium sp. BE184]
MIACAELADAAMSSPSICPKPDSEKAGDSQARLKNITQLYMT